MLYWMKVYALIAAIVFAMAGLCIFICFAWFQLKALLSAVFRRPIGIPVAVTNVLANGGSDNE